jgi:hypothetical protein
MKDRSTLVWYRVMKSCSGKSVEEKIRRMEKLYHAQYCSSKCYHMNLADILMNLVMNTNAYRKPSMMDFANDMHPENRWRWGGDRNDEYWTAVVLWCISTIGLVECKYIPDWEWPARVRKRQAEKRAETMKCSDKTGIEYIDDGLYELEVQFRSHSYHNDQFLIFQKPRTRDDKLIDVGMKCIMEGPLMEEAEVEVVGWCFPHQFKPGVRIKDQYGNMVNVHNTSKLKRAPR